MATEKHISYENLSTFAEQMKLKYAQKTALPTKVSELTNDSGFQTGEQVTATVNAKISSVYKPGGSVAFADLPELTEANLGLVVNVTDAFTTTDAFVDGAGKTYPIGTNVAVVQSGDTYKYDVLAGFVDLTPFAKSETVTTDIATAKSEAIADTDTKLEGYIKKTDVTTATEAEIVALFADETPGV